MFRGLVYLIILLPIAGFAQVLNAESFRAQIKGDARWGGQTTFGFNLDKQRELIYSLFSETDLTYRFKGNQSLLMASRIRVTGTSQQALLNGGFIHFRLRDYRVKEWVAEHYTQFQWDGVRGLESRFIAGSNLRFNFLRDSLTVANLGFGGFYENETWSYAAVSVRPLDVKATDIKKSEVFKFNSYIRLSQRVGPQINLNAVFYYQARPEYFFRDFRLAGSFEIAIPLNRRLEFRVSYDGIYDSAPIVPIDYFYFFLGNRLLLTF